MQTDFKDIQPPAAKREKNYLYVARINLEEKNIFKTLLRGLPNFKVGLHEKYKTVLATQALECKGFQVPPESEF